MNILSIDFDIIMAPDIPLYNQFVRGTNGQGKNVTLETLCSDFPMLNHCRADLNHYQKIVTYLLGIIKDVEEKNIRVAFSHEDIKYMLDESSDVHVFNIDHHHDLGYPVPEEEKERADKICTCANWGDFYFRNGTITKFTWLKNANSDEHPIYKEDERVTILNLIDFDLNTLPPIDKIFLCLSPEWVSNTYTPLFYLILDLINSQKDCHLEIH